LRYLYSLILYLLTPWVLLRLWRRGARVPAYREHWRERFGLVPEAAHAGAVWIHAVSVGEVRAALPLIRGIQQRWPSKAVFLTTTTPTGRETIRQLFGETVSSSYLPYDLPAAVGRFLGRVAPAAAIIMETEVWPNLYHELQARGIPLYLVNARLSEASMRRYLKVPGLLKATIRCVSGISAQTEDDAGRFIRLGAKQQQVHVSGNLKFDAELNADFAERAAPLRDSLHNNPYIWIAGSTHPGEEALLVAAHRKVLNKFPRARLLVAPRHPERAQGVALLFRQEGFNARLYSESGSLGETDDIIIVDVLGALCYLYAVANVAFIGGSLCATGGHNPLEAVLAGAPVVTGPAVSNFTDVYEKLITEGAACMVATAAQLGDAVCDWFEHEGARQAAAQAGLKVVEENQGAMQRTLAILEDSLSVS